MKKHPFPPGSAWGIFFFFPTLLSPLSGHRLPDIQRTYFDRDPAAIYQKESTGSFAEYSISCCIGSSITTSFPTRLQFEIFAGVGQYVLSSFLLYLRVSGLFHLMVGMLRLFGFNLPETHHRYFLAASFTDFWRRINIYWKDFMMKVFYYPMFFPFAAGVRRAP